MLEQLNNIRVVMPSEGSAGVEAAINAVAAAGGGIVQLLKGTYTWTGTPSTPASLKDVIVQGIGDDTIIDGGGGSFNIFLYWMPDSGAKNLNNVAIGDTSIFTTTVGQATSFIVGERICIQGTDSDGQFERVWNKVKTTGNGITGEVQLETAMSVSLDSTTFTVTATSLKTGLNFTLKDFRITNFADGYAVDLQGFENIIVDNVKFENQPLFIGGSIRKSYKYLIKNCRFTSDNIRTTTGIRMYDMSNVIIDNCHFENMVGSPIQMTLTQDVIVRNNYIRGVSGTFSVAISGSQDGGHRLQIDGNHIEKVFTSAIIIRGKDCTITNNIIIDCANRTVVPAIDVTATSGLRSLVQGNLIRRSRWGVGVYSKGSKVIGNTIQDVYSGGSNPVGIQIAGDSILTQGNYIFNTSSVGISIDTATNCITTENIIDTTGGVGLGLSGTSSNNIMSFNKIANSTGVGLLVTSGVTDSSFIGNHTNGQGVTEGTGTGNDFIGNK